MAYVVQRRTGSWEIRESVATPRGPRSRTLATFRVLTPAIARSAVERATSALDPDALVAAARRAGAPLATSARPAADLIAALGSDLPSPPGLRRLLLDALGAPPHDPVTANERAASEWLGAPLERRGDALRDLLLLADRLPKPRRARVSRFPRLTSRPS